MHTMNTYTEYPPLDFAATHSPCNTHGRGRGRGRERVRERPRVPHRISLGTEEGEGFQGMG